jgi:hypothetical protein
MANPNKDLKNVLSPSYAKPDFLLSDWYEFKQEVAVPPETCFYAIDQKEVEGKDYKGPDVALQKDRQVVLQLQKWLYSMKLPNDDRQSAEIGEWIVAERVPCFRGEYIGRHQRVQVPVWKSDQEQFVLMTDPKNRDLRAPGVAVNFTLPDESELILADFTAADAKYDRAGGKAAVSDKAATEVMVLAPDGRLLVHDSAADAKDEKREERLKAYRERIKDVRSGKANEKPGGDNPFGGGGRPGGPGQ